MKSLLMKLKISELFVELGVVAPQDLLSDEIVVPLGHESTQEP